MLAENEFKKFSTFGSTLATDQSYFVNDGSQNFLIFEPIDKILKTFLVFQAQPQKWNLKYCQMKKLIPLLQQVIAFLQHLYGWIILELD